MDNNNVDPELIQTRHRTQYQNTWIETGRWIGQLQQKVENNLTALGLRQILAPLAIDEDVATEALYNNPKLNRLFSTILDVYELLPYQPDLAFDCMWRAFEVLVKQFVTEFEPQFIKRAADTHSHLKAEDYLLHACNSAIVKGGNAEKVVIDLLNDWIDNIPYSALRFVTARMFQKNELQLVEESDNIAYRAKCELGAPLYDDLKNKYYADGVLPVGNHRNIILFMKMLLSGTEMSVVLPDGATHKYRKSLQDRLVFICSSIMYSSRCNRFHGDFFSILKSERSNLNTYYGQYWMFGMCYYLFWIVLYQYLQKKNIRQFFTIEEVGKSANHTLENMKKVLGNKI